MRLLTLTLLVLLCTLSHAQDSFPKEGVFVDSTEVIISYMVGDSPSSMKVFKKETGKWVKVRINGIDQVKRQVIDAEYYRWDNFGKQVIDPRRIISQRPFIRRNGEEG